ncbi:MAG TPA: hypothetical protein VFK05_08235 [Polyangiaceae bacterium]|nr:hypothetical protein [Polyangiaceae bacterium]
MPPFALTRARARRASLLFVAAIAGVRLGFAAEPSAPIASASLELVADASCAKRADLIDRVRARTPRVRFVDDGALAVRVQISVLASGGAAGEVTLSKAGTKPSLRHVTARSCSEVADAAALIIAVTLDPSAELGKGSTEKGTAADSNVAASPSGDTSRSAATAPALPPKQTDDASVSATPTGHDVASSRAARGRFTVAAYLAAEGIAGVAPGVMPGVALFVAAGVERASPWSPSVVLGVRHAWRSDVEAPGGRASFLLDAATLDLCPVRFRRGVIEARPCGSVLFGRFSAQGTDTANAAPESVRPFWVVGGAAVVTAELPWQLEVSARLALGANLVRDSFAFSPTTFHEVPPVSGAASIGLGVRFR